MVVKDSKGREVELSIHGRYDDDIQADSASYTDDGSDVPDDEIDYIMDRYPDEIYEEWYMNKVMEAEYIFEGDR